MILRLEAVMRMASWVMAGLVWLAGTAVAGEAAHQPPEVLRVLSYNIHVGRGMDGRLDLERIARVIRESRADVAALQEVDVNTRRTGNVDQAAELARLTGMHVYYGKAMDYDGGAYGVAILSRFELTETRTHPLGFEGRSEPRVAAEARFRLGDAGPRVAFFCTHLEHQSEPLRLRQVAALQQATADPGADMVILAGDINAQPGSEPMRVLLERWTDATARPGDPTFPAPAPRIRIDYVLFLPSKHFRLIESQVLDEPVASDHRPVLAVFAVER
jgi:endonuclease/exonuclease/phosphatase family metal-dependent hydrolase